MRAPAAGVAWDSTVLAGVGWWRGGGPLGSIGGGLESPAALHTARSNWWTWHDGLGAMVFPACSGSVGLK
jgi:hypothetical protein